MRLLVRCRYVVVLVKHSCPNLANVTRELSKANNGANNGANPAAYKKPYVLSSMCKTQRTMGLRSNSWGIPRNPGRSFILAIATMQETQ